MAYFNKFLIIFIFFLLVGCTPKKDSANNFNDQLFCSISYDSIVEQAKKLNSTSIKLEDAMLFVSFDYESFVFYFNVRFQLIAVDREIHNYFPFLEGDDDTSMGYKNILKCNPGEIGEEIGDRPRFLTPKIKGSDSNP